MKRLIMAAGIALITSVQLMAVTTDGGSKPCEIKRFASLNLTEAQCNTLKQQHKAMKEKKDAIQKQYPTDCKEKHEAMKKLHEEQRAQTKQVLTADQFAQLEKMHEQKRAEHMDKRVQEMTTQLNLSAEQQKNVKDVLNTQHEKQKANKERYGSNEAELKEANKNLHKETMASMGKILTPEQLTKFKEIKQEHKKKNCAVAPR